MGFKGTVYPVHWMVLTTFRMRVNRMGMATACVRKMHAHDCEKGHNGHYEDGRINTGS
jgi:hypothetical protein